MDLPVYINKNNNYQFYKKVNFQKCIDCQNENSFSNEQCYYCFTEVDRNWGMLRYWDDGNDRILLRKIAEEIKK